ncbi:MAG TPA: AAC(3) family N-acetyltransferase [Alphaproteobacteria bacterium]|nr:AAC(3) family N-acetyltransferase [Alphaproteobacteria bacterium]
MPVTADDIAGAFRQARVKNGDVLMLHSDAMVAAQLPPAPTEQRLDTLIAAIESVTGVDGSLVMPTFTYSFTKNEDFDVANSPSTVGLITEHFRQQPNVLRSHDPNFSVAVRGKYAREFAGATSDNSFGPGSAFDLLMQHDGWIGCLGCAFERITFVHYVEQSIGVDYRYFKNFSGNIIDGASVKPATVAYYVRHLDRDTTTDLTRLKKGLAEKKLLQQHAIDRVGLMLVRARDFYEHGKALLAEDPLALLREGQK